MSQGSSTRVRRLLLDGLLLRSLSAAHGRYLCPTPCAGEDRHPLEAVQQICCADRILLNKTDLLTGADTERLEGRLRGLNPLAAIRRTRFSQASRGRAVRSKQTESWTRIWVVTSLVPLHKKKGLKLACFTRWPPQVDLDFILGIDCYRGADGPAPAFAPPPCPECHEPVGDGHEHHHHHDDQHHGDHDGHVHEGGVTSLALDERVEVADLQASDIDDLMTEEEMCGAVVSGGIKRKRILVATG
jgi:G3E family GTPase